MFQSQTGSQALSDYGVWAVIAIFPLVSIPNGKPGPLRRQGSHPGCVGPLLFQSQTGSQALSDLVQQALAAMKRPVSIPNGKPGPLRP